MIRNYPGCTILMVLMCGGICASADSPKADSAPLREILEAGVKAYQEGLARNDHAASGLDFARSAALFEQAIQQLGPQANADLLRNYGHAAAQAGQVGKAVWAYRLLRTLNPHDASANDNLMALRNELPAWVRPEPTPLTWRDWGLQGLKSVLRLTPWVGVGGLLCLAAGIFARARALDGIAIGLLVTASFVPWLTRWPDLAEPMEAVTVATDTILRTADSPRATPTLSQPLPEGVEVRVDRTRGDWVRVLLPHGEKGWTEKFALKVLSWE